MKSKKAFLFNWEKQGGFHLKKETVKPEHSELITDACFSVFHVAVEVDLLLSICGPPKPFNHVI